MNKVSLPLCLFGAALATANILIMQRPTCSSAGAEVAAADKTTSSTQPEAVSTAKENLHKLRRQPRLRPNVCTSSEGSRVSGRTSTRSEGSRQHGQTPRLRKLQLSHQQRHRMCR